MIKYKAKATSGKIEAVDVVRETGKFVVLRHSSGEFRESKISGCFAYFDSFEDARLWLIKSYETKVRMYESWMKSYKEFLDSVIRLEPPSDE